MRRIKQAMQSLRIGAAAGMAAMLMTSVLRANADVTVVSTVSVSGLTTAANGNTPAPSFPITYTTYFQGSKSRIESSDGLVFIVDNNANVVYELDTKSTTYKTASLKDVVDFTKAFPPKLAKRLTVAEDLNPFTDASTATYCNSLTSKTNITGGAHFLIERPSPQELDDNDTPPRRKHTDGGTTDSLPGGFPPTGGGSSTGYPSGGAGLPYTPLPPQTLPGGEPPPIDTGDNQGDDGNNGGDNTGSDSSPDPGSSGGDDGSTPRPPAFKKSSIPDYYISGAIWQSPAFKIPKDKHSSMLPVAIQMLWAGGPFVSDLTKEIDQSHEFPLHSEITIKEVYPEVDGEANILLDCSIKTIYDVQSIITTPVDPALFTVPARYTKDPATVRVPELAPPYVDRERIESDVNATETAPSK